MLVIKINIESNFVKRLDVFLEKKNINTNIKPQMFCYYLNHAELKKESHVISTFPHAGGWKWMIFRIPSKPSHSVIFWCLEVIIPNTKIHFGVVTECCSA